MTDPTDQATTSFSWEPDYGFCATRTTSREDLAHALEEIRRRVCVYGGDRCDCKYGITIETRRAGEETGCPELRELIQRLLHRPTSLAGDHE